MLKFHPSSPFPFVDPATHTYAEAQMHSAEVDRWLGFRLAPIEGALSESGCRLRAPEGSGEKQELWFGLDPQSLLTPYTEIRYLLEKLNLQSGQTVIDLGAGYGRMGFVVNRHFPGVRFVGYEYVGERVQEAKRLFNLHGLKDCFVQHADLSSSKFIPLSADFYFLYDYGTLKAIEKTLYDLKRIARSRVVTLIARGRHCRYLIDRSHPWLKKAHPLESESRVSIYQTEPPVLRDITA